MSARRQVERRNSKLIVGIIRRLRHVRYLFNSEAVIFRPSEAESNDGRFHEHEAC